MATGVLEHVEASLWRLTLLTADGKVEDVFEGPLGLLLDVIEDLEVDITGVRLLDDTEP